MALKLSAIKLKEVLLKKPQNKLIELFQFEELFENAIDAIIVVDVKKSVITRANHAFEELTGYLKEEIEQNPLTALYPDPKVVPMQGHAFSHEQLEISGFFEDVVIVRKDGYPRFVSMSVKTIDRKGSKIAMCILRDVTEKKNMERDLITKHTELREAYVQLEKANADLKSMQDTLVQSGKLAALGELAAGIAHELNQPLTAIKGFAQETIAILKDQNSYEMNRANAHNYINEVVMGADKMEKIISHLRNFTRKSTEDFQSVDLHSVIDESLYMLDKQLKSRGIKVVREFAASLPKVYCNPFQFEQVFINMATNARDAIEMKKEPEGKITIRTKLLSDNMIEVQYEDNGCGIPEHVRSKVFNPFFTTKEVGKGMGLGLSISYGILSRVNASILVESTQGKGTIFTIKIPVDYRQH